MKVLLSGGAGYIGSHCARLLARHGVETVILDDLSEGHAAAVTGRLVQGNIGDRALLDRLLAAEHFDAVFHFAAFISVPESVAQPARYYDNNVRNLQTLLDACVAHGIENFVFSSSAAVFGEPQYTPIDEEHPLQPINPYGRTKLIGEQLLQDYGRAYGLRWCCLRYFCAAGCAEDGSIGEAHHPETHLIPVMIRAARSGKAFSVFGTDYDTRDGSCVRDFVHVEDLAEAHWLGLRYLQNGGMPDCFNLGSGSGFTVLEMIRALEEVSGQPVPYVEAPRRPGDPAALVASSEKAKRVLHWQPKHSDIYTILRDAWNWEAVRTY